MLELALNVFSVQSGIHGFRLVGESNTASADFCRSIGDGIRKKNVGIGLDEKECVVSILGNNVSINFTQKPKEMEKISSVLRGSVSVEDYDDGEFSGCMVIDR
ncbi:MAG: hypothetical protein PHP62_03150 [Candidatus Moranbacteria bacterium]|nr:hypothetical protein [Candidatus Moranbacteria bacterium]